jgi:hypothetical protein
MPPQARRGPHPPKGGARAPKRRSPAADRMRRYRSNFRAGIVYASVPLDAEILGFLLRVGHLRRDREVHSRAAIADAVRAALERAARSER